MIKKNTIQMYLLLPLLALLASCSNGTKIVDLNLKYLAANTTPTYTSDQQAQAQIAEAATAVGHSLQDLSALELARHPHTKLQEPFDANAIGMGRLASVSWTGPVMPLLKQIAKAAHYQLRTIGKTPAIPPIVSLNVRDKPLATILRDATYQIVTKASLLIYPKTRTIELRYHGN